MTDPTEYPAGFAEDANPNGSETDDILDLIRKLWNQRWIIVGSVFSGASIAVFLALSLPNIYTSNALLAPAENTTGGMGGLMKQYGGIASLAGVSLPGSEQGSRSQLGIHILQSRSFFWNFMLKHDALPELLAVDSWDEESRQLTYDEAVFNAVTREWISEAGELTSTGPSKVEAYREFASIFSVAENKLTGYVTVSIKHKSPQVAAQWLSWIISDVNDVMREQDISEATQSIAFLEQQIASTSLAELQTVFFELIQSQTETIMLARVRPEYVFKTIDPPIVPEQKSSPARAIIVILGIIFGAAFGVLLGLVRLKISTYNRTHSSN